MTIEAIVRDAGVGKQTVYRWWKTRADLVLEALTDDARALVGDPDRDLPASSRLQTFLTRTVRGITGDNGSADSGAGPALRAVMADAQADDEARARLRDGFTAERRAELRGLVASLADTQGLRESRIDLLVDMAYGAIWYRLLLGHRPLDDEFAHALASAICLLSTRRVEN